VSNLPSWTHSYRRPDGPHRIINIQSVFDEVFAGIYAPYVETAMARQAEELERALYESLDGRIYERVAALMAARVRATEDAAMIQQAPGLKEVTA